MPSYTDTWSETDPAGTTPANELDTKIAQGVKRALRERFGTDHETAADETGNSNIGYHKKTTYINQGSDATPVTDALIQQAQDDSDPTPSSELFNYHETIGKVQATSKGGPLTVIAGLTNQDAATLNLGDVVVRHGTASSFQGTTAAASTTVIGILTKQTASAASGNIVKCGRFVVNVTGTVTVGQYLITSTTKGKASGTSVLQSGVFGVALTADSGGKVIAEIFPQVYFGISFSGELLGDIAARGASAWERVAGNTTVLNKFLRSVGNGTISALPSFEFAFSNIKVLSGTRAHDAASASVNYVVGFTPVMVIAFLNDNANDEFSIGAAGTDKVGVCNIRLGTGAQQQAANLFNITNNNVSGQRGDINTYASTTIIDWTKVGSPAGGTISQYIFIFLG